MVFAKANSRHKTTCASTAHLTSSRAAQQTHTHTLPWCEYGVFMFTIGPIVSQTIQVWNGCFGHAQGAQHAWHNVFWRVLFLDYKKRKKNVVGTNTDNELVYRNIYFFFSLRGCCTLLLHFYRRCLVCSHSVCFLLLFDFAFSASSSSTSRNSYLRSQYDVENRIDTTAYGFIFFHYYFLYLKWRERNETR